MARRHFLHDREGRLRGADHHDVVDDDRRGTGSDPSFNGPVEALFEVDDPRVAEVGTGQAGCGVEGDQTETARDEKDAFLVAVSPIRDAPPRAFARRGALAPTLDDAVYPERFAGGRVDGGDVASCASGRVEHAIDHERRCLEVVVGSGTEVFCLPAPGDYEFSGIVNVNLVERGVLSVAGAAAVAAPLSIRRALLRESLRRKNG